MRDTTVVKRCVHRKYVFGELYESSMHEHSYFSIQLLLLNSTPSLDPGLVMFSSQLEMVARNISFVGDVPIIVDLLAESVNIFRGTNQYENETFYVSNVSLKRLVSVVNRVMHLQL